MTEPLSQAEPAGFMFTDIVGSTRLWEHYPEAMAQAHDRQDAVVREAILQHGGVVYRSAGDALKAVFADGPSAVRAAIDAQLTLHAIQWELPEQLRVRMAVDLAVAIRTGTGDYRSVRLDLLDAILALAHGGQILLSDAVAHEVTSALPEGFDTVDLGRWRIPGVERIEPIAQVTGPGLPASFPPFEEPLAASRSIGPRSTRFVGRRRELSELQALLDQSDVRLVTLTGPGGIGKTSLAQQLALDVHDAVGGVWFVDLVGLSESGQLLSAIAATMQVAEMGYPNPREALLHGLRDREVFLILDNFEHLLAGADEIARLLAALNRLRILVTSRSPLRVRGEWQYPVMPLSLPSALTESWDELDVSESEQLFCDRALAADPGFRVGALNVRAVQNVCRKLEGLPLAIELAAPLVRVLSMDELNERLNDRLDLVAGEQNGIEERHRAMRASISWSYELLPEDAKRLFRQLGVLQSGFTLDTLDGLLGERFDVLTQVEILVEQNLARQGGFQHDDDHFSLLESVRQFALEQLDAEGELVEARANHARYFSALIYDRSSDQRDVDAGALTVLKPVLNDLRVAMEWHVHNDLDRALALAAGAWRLWHVTGQLADGSRWVESLLNLTRKVASVDRVRALNGQAILYHAMTTYETAMEYNDLSLVLAERIDDQRGIGDACNHQAGLVAMVTGDLERSAALVDRALEAYRRIGDRHGEAEARLNRASLSTMQGLFQEALVDGLQVLAYCREAGKDVLASNTIHGVAGIALMAGDQDLARTLLTEGLEVSRRLGYDLYLGGNISVLTTLLLEEGRYEQALQLAEFVRAFSLDIELGGDVSDPFERVEAERVEMLSHLTEEAAEQAMAAGKRMTPAEAVDLGLALLSRTPD